ncbi:MAG: hypothetical protein JXR94_00605 [Candidatus Hydrogenedentes bacterium]|nr:hypothetical protein [Candidatus Hydrogenedentota bacterium]
MWYSGQPTTVSVFSHVIFILSLIVLINLALRKLRPAWELQPGEILVVYTMLCLASCVCGHDMGEILVPTLSHLHRFAPIEGRYEEVIQHVPGWLVVKDQDALQAAYLGQESIFKPANFIPWLKPLGWWFLFVMALCSVMWGLNLLFRKQWTENEKLAYPVIQLPLLITTQARSLLRNRLFWLAFGIAAFIDIINGLNVLFPLLPKIPIVHILNIQQFFPTRPWNAMGGAWVSFYPFAIGLCFFMPLDLAFSCWFFFWFWKLQRVLASHIGVHGMPGFPFVEEQTAGGYYAIALIAIWITRRHLARVGRILLGRPVEGVTPWDRQEAWIATTLLVGGGAFLVAFSTAAGMDARVFVPFFMLYFLISIAITRMRAELGPPAHDLHHVGPDRQMVRFLGATTMKNNYPGTLAMFGFTNFFNRAYRGHPMPHGLEGFRIAERLKLDNLRYLAAMGIAIAAGTIAGYFSMLWVFDKYGASAQALGPGEFFGRETWDAVNVWFTAPEKHQYQPTYAILIGLVFAIGLAALRMNLTWWPFHPVGYAVSGSWSMEQLWLCVFVAWLVKSLLLKYGGARTYKPAVPFFVGLMMGDLVVGSFWNIYGIVMERQIYHFWPY